MVVPSTETVLSCKSCMVVLQQTDCRSRSRLADRPPVYNVGMAEVDGRIEKGKATRKRLIAAGRALFGRRGYEASSIEDVLAAARVKRGSLYHHFASKEALFDAVLDEVNADIARQVAEAARAAGPDPVAT